MNTKQYHFIHIVVLIMLGVVFFASLIISQLTLRNFQVDLTEKQLWTITDGSKKILEELKEPIEMKLFFSQKLAQQYPGIKNFSQRMRWLLLELEERAGGKIKIEYIDPKPFSEDENRALSYGLRPLVVVDDASLYFGLVGENQRGGIEVVPSFNPKRQHQLEYDLIHMVRTLERKIKPTLGIITSLPLDTGVEGLPAALEGRARPFLIYQELFENFTLEFLEQNIAHVPDKIKTLLIAHPKKLNLETLYAIDQFVLRGGKAMILLDPYCEISQLTNRAGKRLRGLALNSDLAPLLRAWGVQYDKRDIVADRALAQIVEQRDRLRNSSIQRKYVLWLNAATGNIAQDELITKGLSSISLATSGFFAPLPNSTAKFKPLITSSDDSMLFATQYIQKGKTPDALLSQFRSEEKKYILAAKLSGEVKSAFDKKPKVKKKKRAIKTLPNHRPHLTKSLKPTEIILIADSDLLEKRFWIDEHTYNTQGAIVPVADNATFIINGVDALMGNEILIELRGRAPQTRPFTQVDALRERAAQKLDAEEYLLRKKISTIQARLTKFGKAPGKTRAGQAQLLTLKRELQLTRGQLHKVREELNQGIATLGIWIKFFNILFVPLVLILLVLIYPWVRKRLMVEKLNNE
jgi:ABC-type uncharacterized transport system involved in gliding motility auxiliary subunit